MNKYIKGAFLTFMVSVSLTGCNDFLDTMPDNRTTLDSEEKIKSLLVSAYPYKEYAWVNELSSDNSDDIGVLYNETTRWMDDTFNWREESETMTSSLSENWESCYEGISAANEALIAIEEIGGQEKSEMLAQLKGEALLCRAEARIMLKQCDEAAADIDVWVKNIAMILRSTPDMTKEHITEFYREKGYCYEDDKRINSDYKKHLNPSFEIDAEGSMQECMLQCVLAMCRIETLHDGLRWFDIKRYGIEIPRRVCNVEGEPDYSIDFITKDDLRRVYQIPQDVRDAGFQANPR